MKTRDKIFLIIGAFVAFYFSIIPTFQMCYDEDIDCTMLRDLINLTRPVVFADAWDTGDGIKAWSGTVEGFEDNSFTMHYLDANLPFIFTMIIFPSLIITAVVIMDKKRK